jgi:hypothetical protein
MSLGLDGTGRMAALCPQRWEATRHLARTVPAGRAWHGTG